MLKGFVYSQKSVITLFCSIMIVFMIVCLLGYVSFYVISYVVLLCLIIMLIYLGIEYSSCKKKCDMLKLMHENVKSSLEFLPQAISPIEQQYQDLIQILFSYYHDLKEYDDKKYQDMIEYYTLWVHQIKIPISALKLILETEKYPQSLLLEVLKIDQYVTMVLHYLKLDEMNQDLAFHRVSLDDMVSEIVKRQVTFFSYHKIGFEYHIDDIQILTDEKWSSFVIEQILSNAIKYTKKGSIKIYNDGEKLYIEDTGIGIQKSDLPRIMEKGYTGYNGRKDKKASGIGLYLCHKILSYLGHTITIESKIGVGTKVCIDFYTKKIQVE